MLDRDKTPNKGAGRGRTGGLGYYSGGAMARVAGGRVRDAERYRERVRRESYPNRRRRIITGKDLTTPLRGQARVTGHKRVRFRIITEPLPKERMPWGFIFKIVLVGAFACLFILSQIVLFEADLHVNRRAYMIRAAQRETNVLERQLEIESNSAEILRIAREYFGMVEERYVQKKFISSRTENRAVVAERDGGIFAGIVGALSRIVRRDE